MYEVTINTSSYKPRQCTAAHRNVASRWISNMNDYMKAANGWHTTETNLLHVYWRILMFWGRHVFEFIDWEANRDENGGSWPEYTDWLARKCNYIRYMETATPEDMFNNPPNPFNCHRPGAYEGYESPDYRFNYRKHYDEVKNTGHTVIPFLDLYKPKDRLKNMAGCYMEITWVGEEPDETQMSELYQAYSRLYKKQLSGADAEYKHYFKSEFFLPEKPWARRCAASSHVNKLIEEIFRTWEDPRAVIAEAGFTQGMAGQFWLDMCHTSYKWLIDKNLIREGDRPKPARNVPEPKTKAA